MDWHVKVYEARSYSKRRTTGTLPAIMAYNVIDRFGIEALSLDAKLVKSMMLIHSIIQEYKEYRSEQEEQKYRSRLR